MICVDSDCIIDFLNGKNEAVNAINNYKDEIATTEINIFEVFFGVYASKEDYNRKEESAKLFFDDITILGGANWGIRCAKIFTDLLKAGNIIEQNDCFISSIMLANGCSKIITRNSKHFSRIKGIEIITY